MMMSLSREEALQFVNDRLGVKEVDQRLEKDKFRLLNELVVAFHNNIPFQTLTHLAVNLEDRRIPDWNEIKEDLFSGRGGMCFALNGFFCIVLQVLGYDAYITGAMMYEGDIDTHALIIVQNLQQPNDVFLVDVGLGYPTLGAVSLDFELESPTVVEWVWWGKFKRVTSGASDPECCQSFVRMRRPRSHSELRKFGLGNRESPDQWNNLYRFNLAPGSFEELYRIVNIHIYQNISHFLSRSLRLIQWRDSRAVSVINNHLLREEGEGICRSSVLETDEDIINTIHHEFPSFNRETITRAVKQWRYLSGL